MLHILRGIRLLQDRSHKARLVMEEVEGKEWVEVVTTLAEVVMCDDFALVACTKGGLSRVFRFRQTSGDILGLNLV